MAPPAQTTDETQTADPLTPIVITEKTAVDSDDPAILVHPDDPAQISAKDRTAPTIADLLAELEGEEDPS